MSFDNRQEDIEKLLNMKIGESVHLNMFQDGGSRVFREDENAFLLYEITSYGLGEYWHDLFTKRDLDLLIDIVYDVFI